MSCLFCDIVKGNIPSTKVYEDDLILAFRDIDPKAPEHIIIVPKEHIASANDIKADNSKVIAHIFETIPTITKELGINESGYRIVNNCGEEGGQTVGHIHFHLLGGRNLGWPPG